MVYYLLNHGAFDKVYSAQASIPSCGCLKYNQKVGWLPHNSCVNTVLMDIQGALQGGGLLLTFLP